MSVLGVQIPPKPGAPGGQYTCQSRSMNTIFRCSRLFIMDVLNQHVIMHHLVIIHHLLRMGLIPLVLQTYPAYSAIKSIVSA